MNKTIIFTFISIVISIGFLAVIIMSGNPDQTVKAVEQNPSIVSMQQDGKQLIKINAKGGYSPLRIEAKAGVDNVLRIVTNNTFDCSAALVLPDLKIRKMLPVTGTTDIEIPKQDAGKELTGTCSMGMYSFVIKFL